MLKVQKKSKRIIICLCLVLCFTVTCFCGCKSKKEGFQDGQVLRFGKQYMTKEDAMVLLCGLQKKYENMFGSESWSVKFGDSTLELYMKEQVKTQLVQLAGMSMLAEEKNVTLSKEEKQLAKQAAEEYFSCFTEPQTEAVGITKSDVQELYVQYATAMKLYDEITAKVDKEISDDQARMIDVQVIYFSKAEGSQEQSNTEENNAVLTKAYQVWERAVGGENFEGLAAEFNEGSQMDYHIGRGEMEEAFEEAAFSLGSGQISGLVEGKNGIYIIKCISNYNQAETDAHKETVYKEKCSEVFNKEYDKFLKDVKVRLNDKGWNKVEVVSGTALPDVDFIGIYEKIQQNQNVD